MISWKPDALELFQCRCEERRASLLSLGADPDEVFADWKALLESHAAEAGEADIGPDRVRSDLEPLLEAAGNLPPPGHPPTLPPQPRPSAAHKWFGRTATVLLWMFGVVLPLGVLLFELIAGFCSQILFDPMPTWVHVLLVALVPAANAAVLLAEARKPDRHIPGKNFRWLGIANGAAIGIAAYYALQFAILIPVAAMIIVYFGLGLIPLAPLLSFLAALKLRHRLHRARFLTRTPPLIAWWKTAIPAFLLMLLLSVPQQILVLYIPKANDPDPAVRARAVKTLRLLGNRDQLLRRCYRPYENMDFFSLLLKGSFQLGTSSSRADAQTAYYRVTGTPYQAVQPPRLKGIRGQDILNDDWFDPALGGDQVAARIKGLSLAQSRLDGRIDAASGIAYLEWTLEFHNASPTEREARALIELPPGASVSRVTLWINGEPCEAAFGGRSQTKKAYQQVAVQQRRDPVLVTTAGPGRILLQCFPVPVDSSMKTRIGISAPLTVPDGGEDEALLRLPAFLEQNFSAAPELLTSVWIESDVPCATSNPGLTFSTAEAAFATRGKIPADSSAVAPYLQVVLPAESAIRFARDERLPVDTAIRQRLVRPEPEPTFPEALAIVIDGSARMKTYKDLMTMSIFDLIPAGTEVRTFIARDETEAVAGNPPYPLRFAGGCDNGAALVLAAEWAAANGNAPILWLHAAQPLDSPDLEALRQIADFSRGKLVIHSHQYGPGANRIAEQMADLRLIRPLPVADSAEITDFLAGKPAHWERQKLSGDEIPADAAEGSSHIVRLWAADEIRRLSAPHRKTGHDEAVELARTFQLVTPVSGAVVLETAAQYKANDLEPANPATTPGIVPEPATWLLLITGGPLLLALRRRKAA